MFSKTIRDPERTHIKPSGRPQPINIAVRVHACPHTVGIDDSMSGVVGPVETFRHRIGDRLSGSEPEAAVPGISCGWFLFNDGTHPTACFLSM